MSKFGLEEVRISVPTLDTSSPATCSSKCFNGRRVARTWPPCSTRDSTFVDSCPAPLSPTERVPEPSRGLRSRPGARPLLPLAVPAALVTLAPWPWPRWPAVKLAAVYSYHFPAQIKSSITFSSFRCSYGAPALASFVAGEHHHRSRHRCCFCLHGRLASGDNGARHGDQRVRGDLSVLPHHSLAADVATLRPEPAILLRPLFEQTKKKDHGIE